MRGRDFLSAGLLLLAGCSAGWFFLAPGGGAPRFSHRTHAKLGLDCGACHATAGSEDAAGMPGREACLRCHAGAAEREPEAYERRIAEGADLRSATWNRPGDRAFSHGSHASQKIGCEVCHGRVEEEDSLDEGVVARMETCLGCHRGPEGQVECANCHREIRRDARPPSHDASFLRTHGGLVRSGDPLAGRCDLCHGVGSVDSCERCHAETPPLDHTEFWRKRGHGFVAEIDRDRCAACHREDSCLACHLEVEPANHVGSFGGAFSSHCFSCHLPLATESCRACHLETRSHDRAPPRPLPPHPGPSSDCRGCHVPGGNLTHADNGMDCNACH